MKATDVPEDLHAFLNSLSDARLAERVFGCDFLR